jgi:CelD/BcsL family acetyltransferase involved in cellulose biosynthesis
MLRGLGLRRWQFDHLFPLDEPLSEWCWTEWDSPQIDFGDDHHQYWTNFQSEHKKLKHSIGRKVRKLEKDHGPVQHLSDLSDHDVLQTLLTWKSQQYESTGRLHNLRQPWVKEMLKGALDSSSSAFRGRMSALVAGGKTIAIEYSLQSKVVSHMLLCAYDPAYARYSPGLMRNLFLLESGLHHGLQKIDFGKGLEEYKRDIMNAAVRLGEGSVDVAKLRGILRCSLQRSRYWFLRSNLSSPARYVARMTASRFPFIRRLLAMR